MKASAQRAAAAQAATAAGVWLVAALAGLLLAACDHDRGAEHRRLDHATAVGLSDPDLRHPIQFAAKRETLDIEVPDADGLSPNQHIDVVRFLERQQPEAKRRLVVFVPQAARPASIARSLQDIQRHVADAAINYRIIKMTAWERRPHTVPSIRLAYERPIAIAPTCEDWSEDVGRNEARTPFPNGGCASVHNSAVLVGNPLSLPQPEDPRSSERRAHSWSTSVGTAGNTGGGEASAAASSSKGSGAGAAKQ
jgi:pilus biogenesis lipoprotein CpaD